MFSCPLHNWFSYDFPCPACQKEITSTTNIIINADGTNATECHPEDTIKQLQQLLSEKEKVVDKYAISARTIAVWLKDFCNEELPYDEMISDAARKASKEVESLNEILSQKMELLVKANERIEELEKQRSGS